MAEDAGEAAEGRRAAPLVNRFNDVLSSLRLELNRRQQTVRLTERSDPRITQALEWLLARQDPDGFWGYASPGGTALCVLALRYWRPTPDSAELIPATDWLCGQAADGLWETYWDTAVAVRAIYLVGADANNKVFKEAKKHLLELDPHDSWVTERPHHAAQVLNALADTGAAVSYRNQWSDVLRAALDRAELGTSVRAQIVHALMRSGNVPADELSRSIDPLAHYLTRATLSNATFLDQVHALQALAVAKTHDNIVFENLDKIFVDQRRNGSWYHDPYLTAWALLALYEAQTVTRVVMELPAFNKEVERARGNVRRLARLERINVAAAVALGAAATGLAWVAVSFSAITGLLITGLLTILGASYAVVKRLFRS